MSLQESEPKRLRGFLTRASDAASAELNGCPLKLVQRNRTQLKRIEDIHHEGSNPDETKELVKESQAWWKDFSDCYIFP